MARATTRSQPRATQPAQLQSQRGPRGTQSQHRGGRNVEDEEDEDDDDDEGGDEDADGAEDADADINRKANDLVRLALFNEQRRMPLRRDEISKKVLGSKSRRFADVLALAQGILGRTFGMQLVELTHQSPDDADANKGNDTNAVGLKKKAAPTGTKTWILRSTLDPALIQIAVAPDDEIMLAETENPLGIADDGNDDDGIRPTDTGAILAWQSSDQLGTVGILYVVLALVLVHGRAISDSDLRRLMKRLRLPLNAEVPLNSRTPNQMSVDAFLTQCQRQGYLERHRIGEAKSGGNKKRGRGPTGTQRGGGEEEGVTWEWKWGPRAMAEVGEAGIARFVAEFMTDSSLQGDDEDEEAEVVNATARKKALDTMLKGVERASGGKIMDLK